MKREGERTRKQSHANAKKKERGRGAKRVRSKKKKRKRRKGSRRREISGGRAVKARNKASRELARCHFLRKSSFFLAPHARQGENEAGTMVAGIYSEKRISRLLVRRSRKCRKTPAWPRVERIRNYGRGGGGEEGGLSRDFGEPTALTLCNNKRRFQSGG